MFSLRFDSWERIFTVRAIFPAMHNGIWSCFYFTFGLSYNSVLGVGYLSEALRSRYLIKVYRANDTGQELFAQTVVKLFENLPFVKTTLKIAKS